MKEKVHKLFTGAVYTVAASSIVVGTLGHFLIAYQMLVFVSLWFILEARAEKQFARGLEGLLKRREQLTDDVFAMAKDSQTLTDKSIAGVHESVWACGEVLTGVLTALDDLGPEVAREILVEKIAYIREHSKPPNWTENVEDIIEKLEKKE